MTTHVSGMVYLRTADGSIGAPLPGTAITFAKEDHSASASVMTDSHGGYSIHLPSARYYARAVHGDWTDYSTVPGFVVATDTHQICNFFLREPRITTVFVIRHGEKLNPASTLPTEPLSPIGEQRARNLAVSLFRSGITSIHVTDTVRAKNTVTPLAQALMVTPEVYSSPSAVAAGVLADHEGDVTLIVAHSNTVKDVISALGATLIVGNLTDSDFDNMFVVSRAAATVNVINLQYAQETAPSLAKSQRAAMTALLVGTTGDRAGAAPQRLAHTARGAGVSAIYVNGNQTAMVAPLAAELGLSPVSYTASTLLTLVDRLQTVHAEQTVVVSGTRNELRKLLSLLRAPLPILYATDVDHFVILTRFPTGAVQVVPTRLLA